MMPLFVLGVLGPGSEENSMRLQYLYAGLLLPLLVVGLSSTAWGQAGVSVVVPGFSNEIGLAGLNTPRGLTTSLTLNDFPCCFYGVEQSSGRVLVVDDDAPPVVFASGLVSPTDLQPSPGTMSPFGNFLYVAESGANRISKIASNGTVTPFATLAASPRRMAFSTSRGPSAFGIFLFVTLANGDVVKIGGAGVVSPCASGLTDPDGLVFGPGGTYLTNMLFVAERSANRISKISAPCTSAVPFATSGLLGPRTLEISLGGGWGPATAPDFTLYVVNSNGTALSRVDQHGVVTPFASGFANADTVRFFPNEEFFFPPIDAWSGNTALVVSDASTGTIEAIDINLPAFHIQMTGCDPCRTGDLFKISMTVTNHGPVAVHGEIKAGFELPDGKKLVFAPVLGDNKFFEADLPPGFVTTIPDWVSFNLPEIPKGLYCYRAVMADADLLTSWTDARRCFVVLP